MAQWLTLMPRNREATGSNLWGFGFSLKGAYYEVGYCGKKTFLAGLQCTLTPSCAKKGRVYRVPLSIFFGTVRFFLENFSMSPKGPPSFL